MIGTTHVSRGTRGDYDPSTRPGDLTGRRLMAQAGVKEDRDWAIKTTRDALAGADEPIEIIQVPGGRSFAIPRECANYIRESAMAEAD